MPDLAFALLALTGPLDDGVRLDAPPRPGTVVTRPVEVSGEAQAVEGVLRIEMYVVRGASATLVDSVEPELPLPAVAVPFELRWDPAGIAPGRVTIRVVATTLARGFSAEAPGLVVPRPATKPHAVVRPAVRAEAPPPVVAPRRVPAPAPKPALDDSGRAFGKAAPVLPYVRRVVSATRPPVTPVTVAAPEAVPPDRAGWTSVAGGLLLLVICSHLHRVLRTQPDPRDGR